MNPGDWDRLIDLILAQALRTPAFYFNSRDVMKTITQNSLEECMYELSQLKDVPKTSPVIRDNELIPLSLKRLNTPTADGNVVFEATTIVGKSIWQYAIKCILSETSVVRQRFHSMHWSIAESSYI